MSTCQARNRHRHTRDLRVAAMLAACALVPAGSAIAADVVTPVVPGAAPTTTTTTTAAASAFKANRAASQPLGLTPDTFTKPLNYPNDPVILSWTPVPDAASYKVQIATTAGFANIVWTGETDQTSATPTDILPDGDYWWRVTATDKGGTVGLTSDAARFAKRWPNQVSGLTTAATPGGRGVNQVTLHSYFTWNPVPGARDYDVEVAAGDRFATPAYFSKNFQLTFTSPSAVGVLPDDTYSWRVRAKDANAQPGPWSAYSSFTKVWTTPNPTAPAEDATVDYPLFRWDPVEGAEAYQVQVSLHPFTFSGSALLIDEIDDSNVAWAPLWEQTADLFQAGGEYYWRVRPIVGNTFGGWTTPRHFTWRIPNPTNTTMTLDPVADIDSALPPVFSWSGIQGVNLYRIDIATDLAFHNIVDQQWTKVPAYTPLKPLRDNQTGTGYFWRVVWGNGTPDAHLLSVDENAVPVGTFKKQTRFTLGQGANAAVTQAPVLSWLPVVGTGKYELQLSRDPQFLVSSLAGPGGTIYGLGLAPTNINESARIADGTWFWRVRVVDPAGVGQSWSQPGTFTLTTDRPDQTLPADGDTVPGAPVLRWKPVQTSCGYQVQLADRPSLSDADPIIATKQTALALTGSQVPHAGNWFWRVRADMCNSITSQWTQARSFNSVLPPDFGLNSLPNAVTYGNGVVVSGALQFGGRAVKSPKLLLERRLGSDTVFRAYGTLTGDLRGRFAFRMRPKATAAYRLRWAAEASHPEGSAQFTIKVAPRVTLRVPRPSVVRKGELKFTGTVYPLRRVRVQVLSDGGWTTLRSFKPATARFKATAKASVAAGRYKLRILVPGDTRLATATTRNKSLFVYDKFVVQVAKG